MTSMQTLALHKFLPLLLPNVPACPEPVAEQALRLAAAEFCERTRCWRHVTKRTVRRSENIIVAPDYAAIFEIETAAFDGVDLIATQFSDIQLGEDDGNGFPKYVTQSGPDRLDLLPFQEGTLVLSLFLKPRVGVESLYESTYSTPGSGDYDDPADVVPAFLFTQHAETITFGALDRIMNLPGQSYSNPARAGSYKLMFERRVDTHFASNVRGQQRAPARTRPSYY